MKTILIISNLLLLSFWSCKGQNRSVNTFEKEIPTWGNGEQGLFYKLTRQKSIQLKLDDLETGFDSLQIRVWYDYSLIDLRELIELKYQNSKWSGYHYTMEVDWNATDLTEKIKKKTKTAINPKSGWTKFIATIHDKRITTLPNMEDIEGLEDGWTDGVTYNVEIGTKAMYRFYGYHLPNKFQKY